MALEQLIDNSRTDKNNGHHYLGLYNVLFNTKKLSAKNILEIGIGGGGGSIKLWHDYFVNANITAIDILHIDTFYDDLKNNERIKLFTSSDAYNSDFFIDNILNCNIKYDIIIDDGPHTLESMIKFIKLYRHLLADDGIMIIEDIQDWDWIQSLVENIPQELRRYVDAYDLRNINNRWDDILLVINKSKPLF